MTKIRVLLADGHKLVAHGFQALLKDSFDIAGIVLDGRALVDAAESLQFDVIVTDISMPSLNGIDAIRQIRARHPDMKFVVLTMYSDPQLAADAFRAGATGYILKTSPVEELISAIQNVAQGRAYVTSLLLKDILTLLLGSGGQAQGDGSLTARQREVLQLIAEGRTMKEVASVLHISPRTAESHKYEIIQTLGVHTTAELIQYAVRKKLIAE